MPRVVASGRAVSSRLDPHLYYLRCLAQSYPLFTADFYSIDGVSGKVASIIDWNDPSHLLVQSDTAKQVQPPAMHADFGGRLCFTFSGSEWYDSSRSAAYWQKGHDGSGCGFYGVCTPTSVTGVRRLINTRNGAANVGISIDHNATPAITNFISAVSGNVYSASASAPQGVPLQFGFQYLEGGAMPNEYAFKATGTAETNSTNATVPTASATVSLRFGGRTTSNDLAWIGRSPGFVVTLPLSAEQRSSMRNALTSLYGVAA